MSKTIELAKHLEKLHINNMYKSDFYWTWDKTVEELEAICGMDTLGDLSTENAETMRTLGMAIPEAGIAGRKCTRHDTIVMNYHLEKLLSACRYLAELMEQPE